MNTKDTATPEELQAAYQAAGRPLKKQLERLTERQEEIELLLDASALALRNFPQKARAEFRVRWPELPAGSEALLVDDIFVERLREIRNKMHRAEAEALLSKHSPEIQRAADDWAVALEKFVNKSVEAERKAFAADQDERERQAKIEWDSPAAVRARLRAGQEDRVFQFHRPPFAPSSLCERLLNSAAQLKTYRHVPTYGQWAVTVWPLQALFKAN